MRIGTSYKQHRDLVVAHIVNLLWFGLRDLRPSPPALVVQDGLRSDLDVVIDEVDRAELDLLLEELAP